MGFLPFYIATRNKRLRIVIIGGGYAGLAALTILVRHAPNIDITIIDPEDHHLKITHLHETFRYPLSDFVIPFTDLVNRFGFRHIRASITVDEENLQNWQKDKCLVINEEILNFDCLLVATGCKNKKITHGENVLVLQDFMKTSGSDLLSSLLQKNNKSEQIISVVGGGATGIQFLFEIKQFLQRQRIKGKLRLIHSHDHVLEKFPASFNSYVRSCMNESNIDFYPDTYYCEQQIGKILLEEKHTKRQFELLSDHSILFLGKKEDKLFNTNAFGQVIVNQESLKNIFVAGDCSYYQSLGSNSLTAQSAVRKGQLAARNILRHSGIIGLLEPYLHHEIGYVVNLGPTDAVGWLVTEGNLVTGLPALVIKEVVEAQYDFLLAGIDTYFGKITI